MAIASNAIISPTTILPGKRNGDDPIFRGISSRAVYILNVAVSRLSIGRKFMKRILISAAFIVFATGCSHSRMMNMTPEQMMAKVKEASAPGEQHAMLKPLVGKWKTTSKSWMEPGKDPMIDKGTATHQWMYGKRFVKEDFNGKWMKQPFHGMGLVGYDNTKKSYVSSWVDSVSTGMMVGEGNFDKDHNKLDMTAEYYCPISGGMRKAHMVTTILNNNEHTFEMYDIGSHGKETKMMEITYKRIG